MALVRVFLPSGRGFKLTPDEAKTFVAANEGSYIETAEQADIEAKEEKRGGVARRTAAARTVADADKAEKSAEKPPSS